MKNKKLFIKKPIHVMTTSAVLVTALFTTFTPSTSTSTQSVVYAAEVTKQVKRDGDTISSGEKQRIIEQFKDIVNTKKKHAYKEHSVIVKFQKHVTDQQRQDFLENSNLQLVNQIVNDEVVELSLKDQSLTPENLEMLNASKLVEYAEPNYLFHFNDENEYSKKKTPKMLDPDQWGLKNINYPGKDINVEEAWKITKGSPDIVVAVIDNGVDWKHTDLMDRIWTNKKETLNGKDDDGNGYIDDIRGWDFADNDNNPDEHDDDDHGTPIAGVIAATENGSGTIGVAPNVKIMPLRVLGNKNNSNDNNIASMVKAIDYAIKNGAKIINFSIGTPSESLTIKEAVKRAKDANVLFVAAAGNTESGGKNNDTTPFYPASYSKEFSNVIAVGNMEETGSIAFTSNYGVKSVNIAAPGTSILSTSNIIGNGEMYTSENTGTSFAAPFVTGVAALMLSVNSNYTPEQIRKIIEETATAHEPFNNKFKVAGFLNAGKAVKSAQEGRL
ncbi:MULTISPECIES: S8 family peptidase [Bacillus cereus group]|uniref:S8 family peptidase n=1 Tax=Bacillus cereus group TaxID=86661 RepID=UPI0021D34673|nr:S8 family peptidase [Bacillus wiedmannii]MCU5600789.1 S8 family serine peptidase [Bacillus wiedmannii]